MDWRPRKLHRRGRQYNNRGSQSYRLVDIVDLGITIALAYESVLLTISTGAPVVILSGIS